MRILIVSSFLVAAACAPEVAGTYAGNVEKTEGGVIFPQTIPLTLTVTPECLVFGGESAGPPFVFGGEDPSQKLVLPAEAGDCSYNTATTVVWDADPPLTPAGITSAVSLNSAGAVTIAFFAGGQQGTYGGTLTPAP